jgi:mRNA interferase RelE/StbE
MIVDAKKMFFKDLEKFKDDKEKILETLKDMQKLETLTESTHLKKMKGTKDKFRLKVGQYRIVLKWDKKQQIIIAETVALRKDIYKKR